MIKAKTKNKLFTILNAIIGVVFAFIMGVTYCASTLSLTYGQKLNSTSAFMCNQQFTFINDTISSPIYFGEWAHNFEVAIQYSYGYDIDVRLSYYLEWSKKSQEEETVDTSNVILHFANRDNIIYDENYIYLADGIQAGSGKLTFITGVDFVDPTDEFYKGRTLTIKMFESDVKIFKQQSSYGKDHVLFKDTIPQGETESSSLAAKAWLQHKTAVTLEEGKTADTFVMVYNYRKDYNHGVPYPGVNTAYKKPVVAEKYTENVKIDDDTTEQITYEKDFVYGEVWTGGNRAYAGAGVYVVAGSEDVKLEMKVSGIWRNDAGADVSSKNIIFEDSIQFNYSKNWSRSSWDNNKLWETRTFDYVVPAKTVCYIEILDSIEITSASRVVSNEYDAYRAVTNLITINPSSNPTEFSYQEGSSKFIDYKRITVNSSLAIKKNAQNQEENYSKDLIKVINSSIYNNGLYDSAAGSQSGLEQTFNTNLGLINNTNERKTINVSLQLWYHISNGNISLTKEETENSGIYKRAEDYMLKNQDGTLNKYSMLQAFGVFKELTNPEDESTAVVNNTLASSCEFRNMHFSYAEQLNSSYLTSTGSFSITLDPYSGVNVAEDYKVNSTLKGYISSIYNDTTTIKLNEFYDVWVYVVPVVSIQETANESSDLTLETKVDNTTATIKIKNNTNKIVSGLSISNLSVKVVEKIEYLPQTTRPYDWRASYWTYYTYPEGSIEPVPVTSNVESDDPAQFPSTKYYKKTITTKLLEINIDTENFTVENTNNLYSVVSKSNVNLLPGESIVLGSVSGVDSSMAIRGSVEAENSVVPDSVIIVNNGEDSAYILNASTNSYYIRFDGTLDGTYKNIKPIDGYNYYIGILRPGQIMKISMQEKATTIDCVSTNYNVVENEETVTKTEYYHGLLSDWHDDAENFMKQFFKIED